MILHRKTALQLLARFLEQKEHVYVLTANPALYDTLHPAGVLVEHEDIQTEVVLIQALQRVVAIHKSKYAASADVSLSMHIVHAGFPFLQTALSDDLQKLHAKTNSDYSFADGYPIGVTTEFLESRVLNDLEKLAKNQKAEWDALFTIISRNINAFDIETIVSAYDYRALHACLTSETQHSYSVCKKLAMRGAEDNLESVMDLIQDDRRILRTLPNYIRIELTRFFDYAPFYAPIRLGVVNTKLEPCIGYNDFVAILDDIHNCNEGCTIEIGSYGEPSKHPDICRMLDAAEQRAFPTIIVSSGLGWSQKATKYICDAGYKHISFAISIEGYDEKSYQLHRKASFAEARLFVCSLHKSYPNCTYVETVRMLEYEEELLRWYTYWKELGLSINIRKFNNFNKRLPQQKSADLSPLDRHVCWQLEREMTIDCSGAVLQCAQDIDAQFVVGNVLVDGIQKTWEALERVYEDQVQGSYSEFCTNCDEYYIFNG